jgi:MFS family permease
MRIIGSILTLLSNGIWLGYIVSAFIAGWRWKINSKKPEDLLLFNIPLIFTLVLCLFSLVKVKTFVKKLKASLWLFGIIGILSCVLWLVLEITGMAMNNSWGIKHYKSNTVWAFSSFLIPGFILAIFNLTNQYSTYKRSRPAKEKDITSNKIKSGLKFNLLNMKKETIMFILLIVCILQNIYLSVELDNVKDEVQNVYYQAREAADAAQDASSNAFGNNCKYCPD